MQSEGNRPRVFVSSTIYDFADLRSGLKFWLEELGLVVLESEYTDFDREPDADTYRSCFEALRTCHYYVLLIGTRRGSWYRESDRVSVTQEEFRVAAQLIREGRMTPVIFIRRDVVTTLRERGVLAQAGYLDAQPPAPSASLEDAAFTADFVNEVRRFEYEQVGPDSPAGSLWTYSFTTFRDIVDALRVALRLEGSVTRQTLLANLKWELAENLAELLVKGRDGRPSTIAGWMHRARRTVRVTSQDQDEPIILRGRTLRWAGMFWLLAFPVPDRLRDRALLDALASREFLIYHQARGRPVASDVQRMMYALRDAIDRCRRLMPFLQERNIELLGLMQAGLDRRRSFGVRALTLVHLYRLHDELENITRLSVALLRYISTPERGLRMPQLHPPTPYEEEAAAVEAERITQEDAEAWALDNIVATFVTGETLMTIDDLQRGFDDEPTLRWFFGRFSDRLTAYVEEHWTELEEVSRTKGDQGVVAWFDTATQYVREQLRAEAEEEDEAENGDEG